MGYHEQLMAGVGYTDGFIGNYCRPRNFYRWPFKLQRAYLLAWYFGRCAKMMSQQRKALDRWEKLCTL